MRLLLIDDDPEVEDFVGRSLPEGASLDYAQTLSEAERYLSLYDYDEIITDLKMPGITNGDAVTRVLTLRPGIAILVLTQLHFPPYGASLIRQGVTWVMFKPDAAVEPELAERWLEETILFVKANRDARDEELLTASVSAAAVQRLEREVRELQDVKVQLSRVEERRKIDQEDLQSLQVRVEVMTAEKAAALAKVEKDKEDLRGRWGLCMKVVGAVGAAIAAILGHWAAGKWGK